MLDPSSQRHTPGGSILRVARYGPGLVQARHAHGHGSLSLVVQGELQERVGGRVETAGPLSVVVKPAGVEHADSFGCRGALVLQLILSPADEGLAGPPGEALTDWRWFHAPRAARPLLALFRALGAPAGSALDDLENLMVEAFADLDAAPPRSDAPPWLRRASEALAEESVPIRSVAQACGVHPVHLAREFRRCLGASPSEHRRRARLRRAAELLANSDLSLVETALNAGYADQAHMTRDLNAAIGLTPRRLRGLIGAR